MWVTWSINSLSLCLWRVWLCASECTRRLLCRFRRVRASHDGPTGTDVRTCHTRGTQRVHGHAARSRRRGVRRLLRDRPSSDLRQEMSAESHARWCTGALPHRLQSWTTETLLNSPIAVTPSNIHQTLCRSVVFILFNHTIMLDYCFINIPLVQVTYAADRIWNITETDILITMFKPQTQRWN